MPSVLLVPGILGNHLVVKGVGRVGTKSLWLSYVELASYGLSRVRLQEDGFTEYVETYRGQVKPGYSLEEYYGTLQDRLVRDGWKFDVFGYDWRLDILGSGQLLANHIAEKFPVEGVHLVGHSMGGLVARWAQHQLAIGGKGGLVKRIVTLGTPSFGSYATPMVCAHLGSTYSRIVATVIGARAFSPALLFLDAQVDAPFCSWPSIYQLFPDPLGPSAGDDIARPMLYLPSTWSAKSPAVVGKHLEGIQGFWNKMRQALPGGGVEVTVLGKGADTPARTKSGNFWSADDYVLADGDNTVTVEDGTLPNQPVATVRGAHESLPRHPVVLGLLSTWLKSGLDRSLDVMGEFIR